MRQPHTQIWFTVLAVTAVTTAGCGEDQESPPPATPADTPSQESQQAGGQGLSAGSNTDQQEATIAEDLAVPWGIAFLPDGDALIAERTTGAIKRLGSEGELKEEMTVPGVATDAGEGGLLGLAVSPSYERDRLVYAYLTSTEGDNRIVRFELGGAAEPILTGIAASSIHNGGRIAFGPDGKLYAGVGDAGQTDHSQDLGSLNGKILRIDPDGGVPAGNPFPGSPVFTLGHRNVQGFDWDEEGRMWATEFGQSSFDEVNLIEPGSNYGWPEVEGVGDTGGGEFTNPQVTWDTSESSPSGAAVWKGDLYVAALAGERLWRVPLDGDQAGEPEALFEDAFGRLRTAVEAPDGSLWIATSNTDGRGSPRDGDDRIIRLAP